VLNWRYWILDFGFGSNKRILAAIEFWHWAAAFLKKNWHIPARL